MPGAIVTIFLSATALLGSANAQPKPPSATANFDFSTALAARIASLSSSARAGFAKQSGLDVDKIIRGARLTSRDLSHFDIPSAVKGFARRQSTPLPCAGLWAGPLRGLSNPANCVTTTPSTQIDDSVNGLQVGSINNWAQGRVPPALRGIFYLEGNPLQSECFSMGTAYYNETTGTLDTPMWAPKTWSSDPNNGVTLKAITDGTTFQTNCTTASNGQLRCFNTQWERRTNELLYKGDFTCDEVGPNEFRRGSNIRFLPQTPVVPGTNISAYRYNYNMLKIVDSEGKRTPFWQSRYIAAIGRWNGATGQAFVHLQQYQEVPQRR